MNVRRLLAGALTGAATIAAGSAILGSTTVFTPALAGTPRQCMDDSRFPHNWTHGDPTKGLPTSPKGNNGYYYLNVIACSTTVEGKIWTVNGTWRIDIDDGYNHANPLVEQKGTTPFSVVYTGAHIGQFFRVRFANESGFVRPDHASAYSSDSCALVGGWNDTSLVPLSTRCSAESASSAQAPPAPHAAAPASAGTQAGGPVSSATHTATSKPAQVSAPINTATSATTAAAASSGSVPVPSSAAPPPPPASAAIPGTGCQRGQTYIDTVSTTSESFYVTAQSSTLCAQLTWSGGASVKLVIYTDRTGTSVLAENDQATSGELLKTPVVAGHTYKVKVKPLSGTATFSLVVS